MFKMIKAYFFDWMGTLAEATGRFDIRKEFGKDYHHELLVKKLENTNLSKEEKSKIYFILNDATHWLYPESKKVILGLSTKYKLAIISNIYNISAQRVRKLFPKFLENFDVITFSSEVGLKKPDPEIFNYTLRKINKIYDSKVNPEEVVMIGDKKDKDVIPAQSIGMNAILINRDKGDTLEKIIK